MRRMTASRSSLTMAACYRVVWPSQWSTTCLCMWYSGTVWLLSTDMNRVKDLWCSTSPEQRKGAYGQFTTMANVCAKQLSCSSTTLVSRGSRTSRQGCWRMDQLWECMLSSEGSWSITYLIEDIVQLILNYTDQTKKKQYICMTYKYIDIHTWWYIYVYVFHVTKQTYAMVLPGRVPGSDIQLLTSSTTKHHVWDVYQQAATMESIRHVLFHLDIPLASSPSHVVVMKAHTEWALNSKHITFQAILQAELHLVEVMKKRSLYKRALDTAKESVRRFFFSSGDFTLPPPTEKLTPYGHCISAHYSARPSVL